MIVDESFTCSMSERTYGEEREGYYECKAARCGGISHAVKRDESIGGYRRRAGVKKMHRRDIRLKLQFSRLRAQRVAISLVTDL